QSDVKATANAAAGGTGVGISIGLNLIGDASTSALLNGTLGGGNNVTLAAAGSHDLSTVAEGGGKANDGTGVGGGLAITVAMDNDTEARVSSGDALGITGAFNASADHHGAAKTTAKGAAEGTDAAVGVALALSFVDDQALASIDRNITAGGAVSLTARGDGSSKAEGVASSKGADAKNEEDSGNESADDQITSATGVANQQSGQNNKVDNSANTDSSGGDD